MLCGQLPFRGEFMMILVDVQYKEPSPPRRLDRAIPRDLETICLKAMAKDPGKRYATAGELAEDLRRFLRGEPVLARPVGSVARAWRWCRRNPAVASLVTAVAATLLLGIGVAMGTGPVWALGEAQRAFEKEQDALGRKKEADDARVDAENQKKGADTLRLQAERREARLTLERGLSLCEQGRGRQRPGLAGA